MMSRTNRNTAPVPTMSKAFELFYQNWRLGPWALMLSAFLSAAVTGILYVALPWRVKFLGGGPAAVGAVGGLYMGVYLLSVLLVGPRADKWGVKRVILAGTGLTTIIYLLTPLLNSVWQIMCATSLMGLLLGMLWPPLMGWVTSGHTGKNLNRRVGLFNTSWTTGNIVGFLAGGPILTWRQWAPFILCAFMSVVVLICLGIARSRRTLAGKPNESAKPAERDHKLHSFLIASRLGLLTGWAGLGALRTPLLELLKEMNLGPNFNSLLAGALSFSMAIAFFLWGRTQRWHFGLWMLACAQLGSAVLLCLVGLAQGPLMLFIFAVLVMPGSTLTYASHIYYSAAGSRSKASAMAIHEFTLGAGFALGSFGGGYIAEFAGIRWAYPVMGAIMAASVIVQLIIQPMLARKGGGSALQSVS